MTDTLFLLRLPFKIIYRRTARHTSVQLTSPSVALEGRWLLPLCPLVTDCRPLILLAADHAGWGKRMPLVRPVLRWQLTDICDLPGQQRVGKPGEALPESLGTSGAHQQRWAVVTVRRSPSSQGVAALEEAVNVLVPCSHQTVTGNRRPLWALVIKACLKVHTPRSSRTSASVFPSTVRARVIV